MTLTEFFGKATAHFTLSRLPKEQRVTHLPAKPSSRQHKATRRLFKSAALAAFCLMAAFPASAYDFEENGIYYNILSETDKTCEVANCQRTLIGSITVPNVTNGYTVTAIGYMAFYKCTGLTNINIPHGVTSIGSMAFSDCSELTSIDIPQGVTTIASTAFRECTGLTSINIPEGVTTIGNQAFFNCNSLTNVTIPQSVTTIGEGAFWECSGLTSINIPQSVTTIGNNTFNSCSGLTDIEIPQGVTTIGDGAFSSCAGLTNINIPQSVTTIGDLAFYHCSSLTNVNIPQSVTTIGNSAFLLCNDLTSITVLTSTPPSINNVFDYDVYNNAILYVPAGSLDAFKEAEGWKNFKNIKELDPTGIESATADGQQSVAATGDGIAVSGTTGAVEVYTIGGALVTRTNANGGRTEIALPGRGVYIIKVGKQIIKVKK